MPSSYSANLRFELQFTGENVNTWGDKLNSVISRADFSIAGMTSLVLSGVHTLTVANGTTDEARSAILKLSGTTGTLTAPSVSKIYMVWSGASGACVFTTGAGTTVSVAAGEVCQVVCDGTNFSKLLTTDFATARLTSVGNPTGAQDAATKAYVDAQAFEAAAGNLPAQTGNAGKVISTDGTTASWQQLTVSYLSDYASDQATKTAAATKLAIAYAASI